MHPPSKSMAHLPAPLQAYPIVLFEYIKSSSVANERLSHIRDGMTVAIDIEWKQPATDGDSEAGTTKKTKGQKNQLLRSQVATLSNFEIDWDEVKNTYYPDLPLDGVLYVLDILSISIPTECLAIARHALSKISVGIINDVQRLWKDFRLDVTPAMSSTPCEAGPPGSIPSSHPCWSYTDKLLYAATDAHATLTTYLVIREEIDRSRQATEEAPVKEVEGREEILAQLGFGSGEGNDRQLAVGEDVYTDGVLFEHTEMPRPTGYFPIPTPLNRRCTHSPFVPRPVCVHAKPTPSHNLLHLPPRDLLRRHDAGRQGSRRRRLGGIYIDTHFQMNAIQKTKNEVPVDCGAPGEEEEDLVYMWIF
ncbi:hypothetical protein B0H13DRAFT_2376600 [Mycena leptocephala]|nr:hypothetical protein B0H13DRAFT_2376600 [Mycena leptocephala]